MLTWDTLFKQGYTLVWDIKIVNFQTFIVDPFCLQGHGMRSIYFSLCKETTI